MKRILAVFLAVLCLFSLACCTDGGAEAGTESSDASSVEVSTDASTNSAADDPAADSSSDADTDRKPTVEELLSKPERYVALCDQKNNRIIVCDLSVEDWTNDNAVVWEFSNCSAAGLKFRDCEYYGGEILVYCGSTIGIVDLNTKEVLFTTNNCGVNPHSVEVLPDGTLVVASSNDDWVGIYPPGETRPSQTIEHPNAHGVLWDPEGEVLWIVGADKLGAYLVSGTGKDRKLSAIGGMQYTLPKTSAHDLAPVYGDTNKLLITCAAGIVCFEKEEETFSYRYPGGSEGKKHSYVSGCGLFADGVMVYSPINKSTLSYKEWGIDTVFFTVPTPQGLYKIYRRYAPDYGYYKVRIVDTAYQ